MSTVTGLVHVFTYKDGLLSRLGHDLRLTVAHTVDVDGSQLTARFDARSLEVDGAVRSDGSIDRTALSRRDLRDTKKNIDDKVLSTNAYPSIEFTGVVEGDALVGDLTLVGRRRPLRIPVTTDDGHLRGRVTLTPSEWGIKPFKALMGALRLQDRVDVDFDLPVTL